MTASPRTEDISPAVLRQVLDYNPETGEILWKFRDLHWFGGGRNQEQVSGRWNDKFAGTAAIRSVDGKGYRYGNVLGRKLIAHRVAFALMTGGWPAAQIDHINHSKSDNRWVNLRPVTQAENCRNTPRNSSNRSGHSGVWWYTRKKKWQADIRVEGKKINLGRFVDISDAVAARSAALIKYGFHANHGAFK